MDEQANQQVQAAYRQAYAAYGQMQQAYQAAMQLFNRIQGGEDSPKLRQEYSRALRAYNASQAAYKQAQADYQRVQLAACAPKAPTMAAPQPPRAPAAEEDPLAEEDAASAGEAPAARAPVADQASVADQAAGAGAGHAEEQPPVPVAPRAQARAQGTGARAAGPRPKAKTGIPLGGSALGSPMTPEQAASARFWVKFAYVMLFLFPIVTIIFDYVKRSDYQGDPVVASHISYQIITFWIGFAITVVALVLPFLAIGSDAMLTLCGLLLAVVPIWCLVRIVKGFLRLCNNRSA